MTIGADEYMEADIKKSFTESGISHILVVSGANIAFLILFMTFFMKYLPIGKYLRIVIIGSIILFYGKLVGWDVSVVRATIMGIISYLIAEYGARTSSLATLALAGLILTIYNPLSPLYDAGFGLSFGATLGILIFHAPIQKYWIRACLPENIYPFVSVSI
jgi:competence protein ComEC